MLFLTSTTDQRITGNLQESRTRDKNQKARLCPICGFGRGLLGIVFHEPIPKEGFVQKFSERLHTALNGAVYGTLLFSSLDDFAFVVKLFTPTKSNLQFSPSAPEIEAKRNTG